MNHAAMRLDGTPIAGVAPEDWGATRADVG